MGEMHHETELTLVMLIHAMGPITLFIHSNEGDSLESCELQIPMALFASNDQLFARIEFQA